MALRQIDRVLVVFSFFFLFVYFVSLFVLHRQNQRCKLIVLNCCWMVMVTVTMIAIGECHSIMQLTTSCKTKHRFIYICIEPHMFTLVIFNHPPTHTNNNIKEMDLIQISTFSFVFTVILYLCTHMRVFVCAYCNINKITTTTTTAYNENKLRGEKDTRMSLLIV